MLQDFCYEDIELLILEEQQKIQQQEQVQLLRNKRERSKTKSADSRINIVPLNNDYNKISVEEEKRIQYEINEARAKIIEAKKKDKSVRIYKLNYHAKEKDLFHFFYNCGIKRIVDIKFERDKNTLKSKGMATVEFDCYETAIKAINLTGKKFMEQQLLIQSASEDCNKLGIMKVKKEIIMNQISNQNLITTNSSFSNEYVNEADPPMKVYLHDSVNISDQEIKGLFNSFGDVINLSIEEQNNGFITKQAMVTFKRTSQAKVAISKLNGFQYRNQFLQVNDIPKQK